MKETEHSTDRRLTSIWKIPSENMAVWNNPAWLPASTSFWTGIHRSRRRETSSDYDPPCCLRFCWAFHRYPDRAFCRCIPNLACTGTGKRFCQSPTNTQITARRFWTPFTGQASAQRWIPVPRRSDIRSAKHRWRRSRTCWLWEQKKRKRKKVSVRSRFAGDEGQKGLEEIYCCNHGRDCKKRNPWSDKRKKK